MGLTVFPKCSEGGLSRSDDQIGIQGEGRRRDIRRRKVRHTTEGDLQGQQREEVDGFRKRKKFKDERNTVGRGG